MILADWYYKSNLMTIRSSGTNDVNPRPKWKDGTPAHSRFITGVFESYYICNGEFPIPTLRNTAIKTGIREILWIYQKQSNELSVAHDLGVFYWDDWDIGDGTIGNRYGYTVREYDLMNRLLKGLEEDPFSRRHIMNLYQERDLYESEGLYPCAYETLWSMRYDPQEMMYYLDMTLVQRSNDYIVAGYINKIQYVALMMMVVGHLNTLEQYSNGIPVDCGVFRHLVQNLHVYDRHEDAMRIILERDPVVDVRPMLELAENKNFYDYRIDDFSLIDVVGEKLPFDLEVAV